MSKMKSLAKNAQKCPKGNTETFGQRQRWYPSFTSYLKEEPYYDPEKVKYLCYGAEICPKTGRNHWQGCVYFFDKVSLKMAQKILRIGKSHIECVMLTDMDTCDEYCKKEGKFKEFGEMPKQGRRKDLEAMKDDLVNNKITVDEVVLNNPMMYHQYGRTLDKIEDLVLSKKFRTEMTKGIWLYGETAVGKSHIAFKNYSPETHYSVPNDNGWWDNYKQQETVIINDFRGWIKYNELLQLVDKWPYEVKRRGRPPLPFTSKQVIITSSLHPSAVYKNRDEEDSLAQLYRRFDVIELLPKCEKIIPKYFRPESESTEIGF